MRRGVGTWASTAGGRPRGCCWWRSCACSPPCRRPAPTTKGPVRPRSAPSRGRRSRRLSRPSRTPRRGAPRRTSARSGGAPGPPIAVSGQDAARELLWRSFPALIAEPVYDASPDALGGKVIRRPDLRHAVVETKGGEQVLVQSTRPTTAGGDPVDLSLRPADGDIVPLQPLVATRLGARGEDGVRFPGRGFGVRLLGARRARRPGRRRPRRSTRRRRRTPTTWSSPSPTALETFAQLRSDASPEQLDFPARAARGRRGAADAFTADEIPNDPARGAPRSSRTVSGWCIVYPPAGVRRRRDPRPGERRRWPAPLAPGAASTIAAATSATRCSSIRTSSRPLGLRRQRPEASGPISAGTSGPASPATPTASHQIGIMINNPAYFPGPLPLAADQQHLHAGRLGGVGRAAHPGPRPAPTSARRSSATSPTPPNGSGAYHGVLPTRTTRAARGELLLDRRRRSGMGGTRPTRPPATSGRPTASASTTPRRAAASSADRPQPARLGIDARTRTRPAP